MAWPAYYQTPIGSIETGTVYVPRYKLTWAIEQHKRHGRAWMFHDRLTSYAPTQRLVYKSLDALGRHLDEPSWAAIIGEAKRAGLTPPSSYSDLFQQVSPIGRSRPSVLAPFRSMRVSGGWQQCFRTGLILQPLYYYDMRSAYRWAGQDLPDPRSARRYVDFWGCDRGIFLVRLKPQTLPYLPRGGWHFLTTEERDFFRIEPEEIYFGIRFTQTLSLRETWARIDRELPASAKRMSQHYWGAWLARQGPVMQTWKNQTFTAMRNPAYNPLLAHYIVSRVKMRLVDAMAAVGSRHVHMVYVDAILTTGPIPEGPKIGDFRLKYYLPTGGLVIRPGGWGRPDGHLIKRSGLADELIDAARYPVVVSEDDGSAVDVSSL